MRSLRYRFAFCAVFLTGLAMAARAQDPFANRRSEIVKVVERVSPAVVNIYTESVVRQRVAAPGAGFFWSPFDDLFQDRYYRTESLGSGVIVDPAGYVITNNHVIRQALRIVIALYDGSEYEANLVGTDPRNDIAVLKIKQPEGPVKTFDYVPFGRSDDLMIGETVIAIGNPHGFRNTVTVGVISALERRVQIENQDFPGLIQTDAAINPGNSGGPLVNINGDMIGVNTMIQAGAQNIGFAVPSQRVQRIFDEQVHGLISLLDAIGLQVENIPPRVARMLQLKSTDGVIVTTLVQGGYGDQFGVQAGDVILEIDGQKIVSRSDYDRRLTEHSQGQPLKIKVLREGKEVDISMKVRQNVNLNAEELAKPWFGIVAVGIDNEAARTLGVQVDRGVVIQSVEVDSPADRVGLRPGDIIQAVGRKEIFSISDFRQARALVADYNSVEILVRREGRLYNTQLKQETEK
jgi:Do/DeqQ family serine protease